MAVGLILLCAFGAWFLLILGLVFLRRTLAERAELQRRLGLKQGAAAGPRGLKGLLLGLADRCLPLVPRLVDAPGRERLGQILVRAGSPWDLDVDRFVGLRAGLGLVALTLALLLVFLGLMGPHWLAILPFLGWLGPEWAMRRVAAGRQLRIARDLPDFLDVLAVSLGAGCALDQALAAICQRFPGPLAEEFWRYLQEAALGVPRAEALANLMARNDCRELEWLAGLLTQGLELGVPLAQAMAAQAADLRSTRLARAREQAGQAGPKITLVTTFLITPAVLLFLLGLLGLNMWYHPETMGLDQIFGM